MHSLPIISGALRYEFRMQIRRRSVWLVLILISVIVYLLWYVFAEQALHGHLRTEVTPPQWIPPSQSDAILFLAQMMGMFIPLGVGLVLADRLARDRKIHVDEIFDSFSSAFGARLLGKYLGSVLATLIPVLLIYAIGIGYTLSQVPGSQGILLALEAFAAILLPGILFVAGFSITLPAIIKVPLYQFLFIGYWFWANLMSPRFKIPTLTSTMLNAAGPYAQEGFFHFQWIFLQLNITTLQGIESVALLIGLGVFAIVAAWSYLGWQKAHR
ncbi:MAG: hypothetical protein H0V70_05745 [Ktedonobacteraceae bacterium]|nr:hypothetical protein [Ktedonobacteraceae bacterium]